MFEVNGQVQDRLCLVLRILPKLVVDTVYKGLVVSEICLEKTFEFRPSDQSFFYRVTIMLILSLGYYTAQKYGGKKYVIGPVDSSNIKIILILLTKVVAVQVKILIIEVREWDF